MNFFTLVLKQMRQRSLSTWLTLLSVMLGVALAISIMIFLREGEKLFGQTDYGYDLVVGTKSSGLQLVLNTVYHLDKSPGNIPYSTYLELSRPRHPLVRAAWPIALGDEYVHPATGKGYRIIASLPHIFPITFQNEPIDATRVFQYRLDKTFEFARGRPFHPEKFEAVIGSEVARETGMTIGSTFQPQHGAGGAARDMDEHEEKFTVVGILKPTRTAKDRIIITPLTSFYAIGEHEKALQEMAAQSADAPPQTQPAAKTHAEDEHKEKEGDHHGEHDEHDHAYHLNPDGTIHLHLEPEKWKLSAVLVRTRGGHANLSLMWQINNLSGQMAVAPAVVMREFFDTFLRPSTRLLLLISVLVNIVAAVSILVSIYNAVSARRKEIAILRALGATRNRVLLLICAEAALVGLGGALLGLIVGHALGAGGSLFIQQLAGQGIAWLAVDRWEWLYLAGVVVLAAVAGLVPALKAYSTPVATNLVTT